jgi:hypothetical protein
VLDGGAEDAAAEVGGLIVLEAALAVGTALDNREADARNGGARSGVGELGGQVPAMVTSMLFIAPPWGFGGRIGPAPDRASTSELAMMASRRSRAACGRKDHERRPCAASLRLQARYHKSQAAG